MVFRFTLVIINNADIDFKHGETQSARSVFIYICFESNISYMLIQ